MAEESSGSARRNGVQSVEIGIRVLQTLAGFGCPVSLSALAQACDLPLPQAHRYLQSLISTGMARQHKETGRYDLGPGSLHLGIAALARIDGLELVEQMLSTLSQETGLTALISALGPLGPTVIRYYMGQPAVVTSLQIGSVLPFLTSATGQVFFSFVPDVESASLIAKEAQRLMVSNETIEEIRRTTRENGFVQDKGKFIPGLCATAFPIFDIQKRARLVVTALGVDAIMTKNQEASVQELGRRCAALNLIYGRAIK